MKPLRSLVLSCLAAAAALAIGTAAPAQAGGRVAVGVSIGTGWYGGPGYYPRYYAPRYAGYPADYYPPPAVVVAPPPPPPVVVYQQPAPTYYVAPQPPAAPPQQQAYCREYQKTLMIGGRPQPGYGTACMQPDGSWKAIN